MKYVIGVDIGTSGTKTILFDETGKSLAQSTIEYPMYQPKNGWAEQEPEDWWEATRDTIINVVKKSGVNSGDIKGIGLSGQMHGLVMLDDKNEVIRNAIIWCDQRTHKECIEITEKVGAEKLIEITANPALTGFTASKILWVRNNEPENFVKCEKILLPKDYIRFMLTNEYATEVSDASGMQLLDIKNRCWSKEVLEKLEIPESMLGKVYESVEVTGNITENIAKELGLTTNTVVVGGAGDNAAAAVGTGVVKDGSAFTTIGTSGVVYAHTKEMAIDKKGRVHTFCSAVPNEWHVMGVTQGAGLSMQWFRNNFCQEEIERAKRENTDPYVLMTDMASKINIGADKLIYLPYLMGERTPHLDSSCRGVFFGLSAIHSKAHLIRAVLEGVSYSLKNCADVLKEMGVTFQEMIACGGGGKSALWRSMLGDLYECEVSTIKQQEGPALGVAILALVGIGVYHTVEEACGKILAKSHKYEFNENNSLEYKKYYGIYNKLYDDLKVTYRLLGEL
ncbi:MAG: xylulokinase [Lachnospirales bacterium]